MRTIKLNRKTWKFDDGKPLGPPGGFGRVYSCPDETAIKRLFVTAAEAKRELTLADALADRTYKNIVPVFDAGEDVDTGGFFIVMPKCEMSLSDHLKSIGGKVSVAEAIAILRDIASGLVEVGDIVHRDMKPGNVLLHEGCWKIADFGIARFVEDTTSLNTMKECLTPPFAAPEQWHNKRATKATDIYALGCIAHVLLSGSPPFHGADMADWQQKHDAAEPKALPDEIPGKLRSLIYSMLRKPPDVRPSAERVVANLIVTGNEPAARPSRAALSNIDAQIERELAQREAAERAKQLAAQEAIEIEIEGERTMIEIRDQLFSAIQAAARNAAILKWEAQLRHAILKFEKPPIAGRKGITASVGSWTLYNTTEIKLIQRDPRYEWGASLWYGTDGSSRDIRWHQLSFMDSPLLSAGRAFQPYALSPTDQNVGTAFSHVIGGLQFAETPRPIDAEDLDDFIEEWIERFSVAAVGNLRYPSMLPLAKRK